MFNLCVCDRAKRIINGGELVQSLLLSCKLLKKHIMVSFSCLGGISLSFKMVWQKYTKARCNIAILDSVALSKEREAQFQFMVTALANLITLCPANDDAYCQEQHILINLAKVLAVDCLWWVLVPGALGEK